MASISTNIKGERVVYYTVVETAEMVRKALKAAFPRVKFSVTSKKYSGGSSISVGWTDGPNDESVKAITDQFEGATFDGMQDLKSYVMRKVNGHQVHYGGDYIFTNRHLSATYLRAVAERVARYYRKPVPDIHEDKGSTWIDRAGERISGLDSLGDIILQRARETAAPAA